MAKKLFIGSLPTSVTLQTLRELCSQHGRVLDVSLIVDRNTGLSRGFGFVQMETEEATTQLVHKLNGYSLNGSTLIVKEALPNPTYRGGVDSRSYINRRPRRFFR